MKVMRIGSAVVLILTVAKAVAPDALFFLPLGGSVIAEVGIALGGAYAITVVIDTLEDGGQ